MYFIGTSTGRSLIMRVFPRWRAELDLGDCALRGVDLPLHAPPGEYRAVVDHIATDPLSLGALVTSHKLDLFAACRDRFDVIDEFAALMHEASSISKRAGTLVCHAKDPISSALAMDAVIPSDHWRRAGGEAFIIGAGGAATAIAWALARQSPNRGRPKRIVVSDVDDARLTALRAVLTRSGTEVALDTVTCQTPSDNDAVVSALPPGSLVVNATGLGKDAPGSPIGDAVAFPMDGLIWELNYRGELTFLRQARAQQNPRRLCAEDGWTYFIYGWTQVIAEVFNRPVPAAGDAFDRLVETADAVREEAL